jgi:hypothetical protein
VRLLGLPVRLVLDSRDRHDSLMREFALLALSPREDRPEPPRMVQLTALLGVQYGRAQRRPDELVDDALNRGEDTIDVSYDVPASVLDDAARLEALMVEADELCRSEQLLTLPRNPLQVRFSHWYIGEFRRQVAGEPPQPWDGPLDP